MLLNVSSDGTVLPTTYGKLKPPLGKHRLKVACLIMDLTVDRAGYSCFS